MSRAPGINFRTPSVALAIGLFGIWFALASAQTPPEKPAASPKALETPPAGGYIEEEEANPRGVKKRITIEDETPDIKVPRGAYYMRIEEIARLSVDASLPQVRKIYSRYVVAFDQMTDSSNRVSLITPIPVYRTDSFPEQFGVFELDERNEPRPVRVVTRAQLNKVEHYEELIQAESDKLIAEATVSDPITLTERLAIAENLLSAALFFHDSARDQNRRKGKGWERVRVSLVEKLADTRLKRLKNASARKDWKTVRALGSRMVSLYPNNTKLLEEVFAVRLSEGVALVTESDQPGDLEMARELITDFESRFPGSKNTTIDQVRTALQQKVTTIFNRAQAILKRDEKEAQRLMRIVETIDPTFPGLRELQGQLTGQYSILYVGCQRLPEKISPIYARSDEERRAVGLIFEGLMEAVPDEANGNRYRPALCQGMPLPERMARDCFLNRNVEWMGLPKESKEFFQAADVSGTYKLLRENYAHTWAADGIQWVTESTQVEDPGKIRIGLSMGHPHPLSLLTTKILPTRYLASRNLKPHEPAFTQKPIGTGPYRFSGLNTTSAGPGGRDSRSLVFTANPNYSRRPGRLGQPFIKEIRMVELSNKNVVAEFKADSLHILPDVPTSDLRRFTEPGSGLNTKVEVVTATAHRRIHALAFNYRQPTLRSPALRRAIMRAIDREEILNQVFRVDGNSNFHKALNGPFPLESWAAYRPLGATAPPLFEKNLAQANFAVFLKQAGAATLRILVPSEDLLGRAACDRIKRQLDSAIAGVEGGKITIDIEAVPADQFDRRVYEEGGFDIAYVPIEYPNDLYSFGLASMLDPHAAERGGRNFMYYRAKSTIPAPEDDNLARLLTEVRQHSDFNRIHQLTQQLNRPFTEAVPFVPLWQLDRHMVISRQLKIFFDDSPSPASGRQLPPSTIFAGVARWRLD